jgi:signal transduction histidine kinase
LDSIFQNLISNAVKYGITQFSKRIEIFAEKKEGETTIYIKDYGLGMDLEKNKKKLFKLGSRFHNSSGDSQGIGLYMIKRQIEAIGGVIDVESTINKGTIFKVCFYD